MLALAEHSASLADVGRQGHFAHRLEIDLCKKTEHALATRKRLQNFSFDWLRVGIAGPRGEKEAHARLGSRAGLHERHPMLRAGLIQQQHLKAAIASCQRRRAHLGVVEDQKIVRAEVLREIKKMAVLHAIFRAMIDQQPRFLAAGGRMGRDQLRRQLVFVVGRARPR